MRFQTEWGKAFQVVSMACVPSRSQGLGNRRADITATSNARDEACKHSLHCEQIHGTSCILDSFVGIGTLVRHNQATNVQVF